MPVEIQGLDKVVQEFRKIANNTVPQRQFIELISKETLFLLRNNTPVDTGELRDSWREIYKSDTELAIGTRSDQLEKLSALVFGTRYTRPRDFLTPIVEVIANNVDYVLRSQLKPSSRYLSNMSSGSQRSGSIRTPSGIVGLTKTKFVKRRGRGRSYIGRIRTGKLRLNRRLGRRRRV